MEIRIATYATMENRPDGQGEARDWTREWHGDCSCRRCALVGITSKRLAQATAFAGSGEKASPEIHEILIKVPDSGGFANASTARCSPRFFVGSFKGGGSKVR